MKVLFVSNLFPDQGEPYRGLDNATVLHHLAASCEIRILALRPSLPLRRKSFKARPADERFNPRFLPIPYVPKIGSLFNHRLAGVALRKPLRDLRAEFPFDVVLGSWLYPDCCALAMLAKEDRFPLVAIAQGSDAHQYLAMPVRRRIVSRWLPEAAGIVTRSTELARLLGEAGFAREKLHPIYNGIDRASFHPASKADARSALGLPQEAPILLYVGNFLPIKNPLMLVRAHAALCQEARFTETRLVMIGSGPLVAEARQTADAMGFGPQVILAGRRDAAEIGRYMQAADTLCLPSRNEGVPNVVIEAFACGLPVTASRVGGIPEVHLGDAVGRLFPAGDEKALIAALGAVLQNRPDRDAIHRHSLRFSWEQTASEYRQILEAGAKMSVP